MPKGSVTVVKSVLYRSPFEGHTTGDRPTRSGGIGVTVAADMLASVTQVSTWHTGVSALCEVLGVALGQALPAHTGDIVRSAGRLVMRTGPEEFLIISDEVTDMTALLRQSITADVGSVTNLSHARCRIHLEGPQCLQTLSKLFPIDLRDPAFPHQQIRLTGHHHVPSLLHRLGAQSFDVYVFSTYAFDQLATVLDAAREYGVSLKSTG
jgi:methylglutamate dehydrogenase subunit D